MSETEVPKVIHDLGDLKRAIDNYLEYCDDFWEILNNYLKRCYDNQDMAPFVFLNLYLLDNNQNIDLLNDFLYALGEIYDPRKMTPVDFRRFYDPEILNLENDLLCSDSFEAQILNIGFQVYIDNENYSLDEKFIEATIHSDLIPILAVLFGGKELYSKYSHLYSEEKLNDQIVTFARDEGFDHFEINKMRLKQLRSK